MSLSILSFLAWLLSILAPCVLPVLPVILWWSLWSDNRRKPLTIIFSTGIFITVFTVALKASTALIDIPQSVWTTISAVIIILYGLTLAFPHAREVVSLKLWLYKANQLADSAQSKGWFWWDVLLGASLGPIFASCSPTYALLLSTVFPQSFAQWIIYTLIYSTGFVLGLLAIAYGGRSLVRKLSIAANPNSWFKKVLWWLLILTGLLIISWWMKKLEVAILDAGVFNSTALEQSILERNLPNP